MTQVKNVIARDERPKQSVSVNIGATRQQILKQVQDDESSIGTFKSLSSPAGEKPGLRGFWTRKQGKEVAVFSHSIQ